MYCKWKNQYMYKLIRSKIMFSDSICVLYIPFFTSILYCTHWNCLQKTAVNVVFFVIFFPQTLLFQCYEWVLRKAQMLDWSEDSAKALVVIGDCEPHPPSYTDQNIFWKDEVDVLKGMGVKVTYHGNSYHGDKCNDSWIEKCKIDPGILSLYQTNTKFCVCHGLIFAFQVYNK